MKQRRQRYCINIQAPNLAKISKLQKLPTNNTLFITCGSSTSTHLESCCYYAVHAFCLCTVSVFCLPFCFSPCRICGTKPECFFIFPCARTVIQQLTNYLEMQSNTQFYLHGSQLQTEVSICAPSQRRPPQTGGLQYLLLVLLYKLQLPPHGLH